MSSDRELALAPEWVSARPTAWVDVGRRIVRLPWLVLEHRDLVRTTLRRDIAARFQGTLFGWAWPLLQPLFLFSVYFFIFTELLQQRMGELPEDKKTAMAVYMFSAMLAWGAFSESLTRGTTVIVDNGNLIKKLVFPSELLPLNTVLASLTVMLFGVAIFVLATVFTPVWPAPGVALLWLPAIVLVQAFFTYGCVLFLATLQVFLRDTVQIVSMVATVWMFMTPVFWVPELMGEGIEPYRGFLEANPAFHMVSAWRGALMGDLVYTTGVRSEHPLTMHPVSVAAIPEHLGVLALWALGAYAVGYTVFVFSQRRFADEV
jgi:lipopolysaccharide transport system permease protein